MEKETEAKKEDRLVPRSMKSKNMQVKSKMEGEVYEGERFQTNVLKIGLGGEG